MAIVFRDVIHPPYSGFSASAPNASVVGVVGWSGSGVSTLLRLASREESAAHGEVLPDGVIVADLTLDELDPFERARQIAALNGFRRAGGTVLLASHHDSILTRLCDEVWWIDDGRLVEQGDPRQVLACYHEATARRLAVWGATHPPNLDVSQRRGDQRAEVTGIEAVGEDGRPTLVLRNHNPAAIRVRLRYLEAVQNPVVGIMLRTRVGLEVYGTNTELEGSAIGACQRGDELTLEFQFNCALAPGDYTVTAASHDPDGTAHDWLDDAIAFSVVANRYTAGVADLQARLILSRNPAR